MLPLSKTNIELKDEMEDRDDGYTKEKNVIEFDTAMPGSNFQRPVDRVV